MTKRMLIDASHAEETRVVVLDGNRLEDFDVETATKRQLKGNIYLAKVVRVEPSLQAAFVEYGGNRHGFLAFSEIHPDYYQIPIADRQRLLDMEAEEARREEEEADLEMALDQAQTEAPVHDAPIRDAPVHDAPVAEGPNTASAGRDEVPPSGERYQPAVTGGAANADGAQAAVPAMGAFGSWAGNAPGTQDDAPASTPSQPLVIEPELLSGPVESATLPTDGAVSPNQSASPSHGEASDTQRDAGPEATGSAAADPEAVRPSDHGASTKPSVSRADEPGAPDGDKPGDASPHEHPKQFAQSPEAAELFGGSGAVGEPQVRQSEGFGPSSDDHSTHESDEDDLAHETPPETVGGDNDTGEERAERRIPPRFLRNYKIQEVIRRRQILLVQVVKEERGTKGAALTTYISLAGRFSVLMPNSPRGGGISRKITSAADRRRLKEVTTELDIPRGMGLIVRTAGANRPKPEIKRDCEYLLRLWDDIRDHTMNSVAPALIYEEASLIKRAIRDVYSRDVDDIQVDGEEGWRAAHDFMRMLMPTHAKKVQLWRDPMPLFARYQVEAQLDAMLLPTVQLRSGGYLVINQAEALVAIDVNSGRSTRERGIEETALRTNLEAADEVARQLRLRDLAGLIVIDFIDMEHRKHNAMVERRLKEALKNDRARIQVGQISHFGLMEMSRQRLRPSLAETSFVSCPHCGGTGHVRSTESAAIHVLRGIEDEGGKRRAAEIVVHVAIPIALYLLNHKRERLHEIEYRYAMRVIVAADDSQFASQYRIERVRPQIVAEALPVVTPDVPQITAPAAAAVAEYESDQDEDIEEDDDEAVDARGDNSPADPTRETAEEAEHRRKRRRRRRRGRRDDATDSSGDADTADAYAAAAAVSEAATVGSVTEIAITQVSVDPPADGAEADGVGPQTVTAGGTADTDINETHVEGVPEHGDAAGSDEEARNRRRGRRGGRRRRREMGDGELTAVAEPGAEQPELPPLYTGPTPANPFGGQAFDIFDVLDQAEQSAAGQRRFDTPASRLGNPDMSAIGNTTPPDPAMEALEPGFAGVGESVRAGEASPAFSETEQLPPIDDVASLQGMSPPGMSPPGMVAAPQMAPSPDPEADDPAAGATEALAADGLEGGSPTGSDEPIANGNSPQPALTEPLEAQPLPADATSVSVVVTPAEEPAVAADAPSAITSGVSLMVVPSAPTEVEPPDTQLADPVAANDVTSEPAIKPIVIGSAEAPPVEKKRGWWRR